MSQVVQLNTTKTSTKAKAAPSKRALKANRRQAMTATVLGGVAVALAALSLSDLAHGIALASPGSAGWQSWALAIGIDCGFIGTELVQLTIGEKLRKAIGRYSQSLIAGTMIGSAVMNAAAFAASASGWQQCAAAALGIAIPGLIYVLTKIATTVWIDSQAKA